MYRGKNVSTKTAPWLVSYVSLKSYLPGLESQHLKKGCPPARLAHTFAWSFPPIFMLIHPVACVLLDMPIFFSILLWGEITFSGLNSHLIRFIFKQPLHLFLCILFSWAFSAFFLSLSWLPQKVWAERLVTIYHDRSEFLVPGQLAAQGVGNLAQLLRSG